MTRPRSLVINDQLEGTYHCVSRCVRRAFLHGKDSYTGKSYEHRKVWIHQRLVFLAEVFFVDVGGYALMDNHLHVVLRNRPDLWQTASARSIAQRWLKLYPKRRDASGRPLPPGEDDIEQLADNEMRIAVLRRRLGSISWIMKCLKEYISRKANAEDGCGGRFWESRFKCTALLDDAAVLTCLVYVDLNPVRANLAESPEASLFTSAEERIRGYRARQYTDKKTAMASDDGVLPAGIDPSCDEWLCPLDNKPNRRGLLSLDLPSYLEILEWTGRQIAKDKPGVIPRHFPPILTRLAINPNRWVESAGRFGVLFSVAAGTEAHMKDIAARMGQRWVCGIKAGKNAFLG